MACGDVLSLEDLQTAKRHQIFEAEVITGKAGGVAGGATIGTATNPVTGQTQQTLPSILADLGFDVQSWTSSTGGVLASANQVFLNDTPGSLGLGDYYAWGGPFPKTVPAGTDPALPTSGYIMRSSRFAGTQARESLRRSYAEAGYNLVDGSFEAGGTLVNASDVLLQERSGKAFTGPAGTVAAGTNPAGGGFVDVSGVVISIGAAFGLNMSRGAAWAPGATATDIKSWFVYAGEVWSPLSVPVTLPSAPNYANFVRLAVDGAFRPSQFGAVGDADESATPTDDTAAFTRGLSYCASIGRNMVPDADGRRYSVTQVAVPIGITRFRRFKVKARTLNDQLVYTKGPLFGGVTGIRCDVYGLDIDCNNLSRQGFVSNGHEFSDVKKVRVRNIRLVGGSSGVRVALNCRQLHVEKCEIVQQIDPDNGNGTDNLAGISVIAETSSVYGGLEGGGGPVYPVTITVTDIFIEKNVISNGTHGVQLQGLVRGRVGKNTITGSTHRNVNLSPACQRITVSGNDLLNAGSSAVNIAWGCKNITVRGNRVNSYIVQSVGSGDDAAIQAYQWAESIEISGNEISGDWRYCVYVSQCRRVTIRDNKFIDGASLANIMVETSWFQSAPPADATYSKQRVSPVLANTDSYLIEIYGNEHGGSGAAVAIAGTGGLTLAEANVHDETIRGATRSRFVHVYSDSLALINAQISLSDIRGSLLAAGSNKYFSSYGRAAFNSVKNVVGLEDDMIEQSVSGATPSAFYGPNLSVPAAATITDFINGQNGQILNVRLSAGVTIVNSSDKIRLRGGANINATATSEIVTLKRIQAVWFEIGRNF